MKDEKERFYGINFWMKEYHLLQRIAKYIMAILHVGYVVLIMDNDKIYF